MSSRGAKFTDAQVRGIKEALLRGCHPLALARHFKVSYNTIWRIQQGHTYNHVEVEGEEAMRGTREVTGLDPALGNRPLGTQEAREQERQRPTEAWLKEQQDIALQGLLRAQQEQEAGQPLRARGVLPVVQTLPQAVLDKVQGFMGTPARVPEGCVVAGQAEQAERAAGPEEDERPASECFLDEMTGRPEGEQGE